MKVHDPQARRAPETRLRRRNQAVRWTVTGDDEVPYQADVSGEKWLVRVNDFPSEHLYTLIVDSREADSFDDWPPTWLRPEQSVTSGDDIYLSELIRSLRRSLAAGSPEREARIEQIARAYASGVYRLAEERASKLIEEALKGRA